MEVNNRVQTTKNPPAFLERKVDPRSTKFILALTEAMEPAKPADKKLSLEPAALTRLVRPRSSIELRSLISLETELPKLAAPQNGTSCEK